MRKLFILIALAALIFGGASSAYAVTEFISTIKSSGGDYTTFTSWQADNACSLTASNTKVFSYSSSTGSVSHGQAVTGASSSATGTVVHVTSTQILIKNITGTFTSGEQVRVDVSNYVVISNAGDSAISVAECYIDLNESITFTGWTSDTTNYPKLTTDDGSLSVTGDFTSYEVMMLGKGTYTFSGDFDVTNAGNPASIICEADNDNDPAGEEGSGVIINAANFTIGSSASISADGQGFAASVGPGEGGDANIATGGGHGGMGGGRGTIAGSTYGSYTSPTSIGSGGGNDLDHSNNGSAGGGAIKLNAGLSGIVTITGTVTANGANYTNPNEAGGGAGGSIWIVCDTLTGSGTITANGGNSQGDSGGSGGGGGGGRIALEYSNYDYTGAISASGGTAKNAMQYGSNGTLHIPDGEDLSVDGSIALAAGTHTFGDLTVLDDGVIECQSDNDGTPENGSGVIIVADNVYVNSGGTITADYLGFLPADGPDDGKGVNGHGGSGGGHGGAGGDSTNAGGQQYGSVATPVTIGSGGGEDIDAYWGSCGGGAIQINASGIVEVYGSITADGEPGYTNQNGGGAGGSIYIIADTFDGTGTVTANGGSTAGGGTQGGGAGAGGRIAIKTSHNESSLTTITVNGGQSADAGGDGQAGTIVWYPIGGYDNSDNVIPSAQCAQSTNADGKVTITFKAETNGTEINGEGSAATGSGDIFIDEESASYTPSVGDWSNYAEPAAYNGDFKYHIISTGSVTATCVWTPTIPSTADYNVFTRWTAGANRPTDAHYTVNYNGGSFNIDYDQNSATASDYSDTWIYLGRYNFSEGSTDNLTLSNDSAQSGSIYAIADAAWFQPASYQVVVDDQRDADSGAASSSGVDWDNQVTEGYSFGEHYVPTGGSGSNTFTWRPDLPAAGDYHVYAWWRADSTFATNAPYTIYYATGSETVTKDQRTDGSQWNYLGEYAFDAGTGGYVVLSDNASGTSYVMADAVKFIHEDCVSITDLYSLHTFKYSTNGGSDWATPSSGDTSSCLSPVSGQWMDNSDSYYNAASGLALAPAYSFVWDTDDSDMSASDLANNDQSDVQVQFVVRTTATQSSASYNMDSREVVISESFSVDNVDPTITSVDLDYDTGVLTITCDEEIDADPASNVDLSQIHLRTSDDGIVVEIDEADFEGSWTPVSSGSAVYNSGYNSTNVEYAATGSGGSTYTWTPTVESAGSYKVYAWWGISDTNRATDAPYFINYSGGSTTVDMDQTKSGRPWQYIGTYNFDAGTSGYIQLSNDTSTGFVIANAIQLYPAGLNANDIILDNTDATYVGTWNTSTIIDGYGGDHQINAEGSGNDKATWRPTITTAGNYAVYITYPCNSTYYASNAPYTVYYDGGSESFSIDQDIDQRTTPGAGDYWHYLGTYPFDAGTEGYVQLTDNANDTVAADAVRFIPSGSDMYSLTGATVTASETTTVTITLTEAQWSWASSLSGSDSDAINVAIDIEAGVLKDMAGNVTAAKHAGSNSGGNISETDPTFETKAWNNSTADGKWSTAANWTPAIRPGAGDDVVFNIDSSNTDCLADSVADNLGSIYLNSDYTSTLTLSNGFVGGSNTLTLTGDLTVNGTSGTIICQSDNDGTPENGAGIVINADEIIIEGTISADEQGFPASTGPGAGGDATLAFGAGHGGVGGITGVYDVGSFQGLQYGSYTQPTSIGSGGGDDGAVLGGAGGGAIKLVASSITVNGTLSANGGDSAGSQAGGGSGGSIWIVADTIGGYGAITANGGESSSGNGGGGGGGRISLDDYTAYTFSGTINAKGGASYYYTNDYPDQYGCNGTLHFNDNEDFTINGYVALVAGTYTIPNLTIASTGNLECQGDTSTANGTGVIIDATNVTINHGGKISADWLGFTGGEGLGAGTDGSQPSGAGYGGAGGDNYNSSVAGGSIYGSVTAPDALGSGGGNYTSGTGKYGGRGGGAIKIVASSTFTNNGDITADGGDWTYGNMGGGAGGSIWIIADILAGGGTFSANGGSGQPTWTGSGAGGRIALYCSHDQSSFKTVTVTGNTTGNAAAQHGEDGTIVRSPIGGYTAENVIPSAQCAQSTDGDGVVTINFKGKTNGTEINGTSSVPSTLDDSEIIVDEDAADFVGTWTPVTNNTDCYNNDAQKIAAGSGSNSYTWTPTIPSPGGSYNVYVKYPAWTDRATDAPYTVNYNGGSTVVTVNQKIPGAGYPCWFYIGTYDFAAGTDGYIKLTDDADGWVFADAVRLLPAELEIIMDDNDATYAGTTWDSYTTGGYGGEHYHVYDYGIGDSTCTWTPTIPSPGGDYRVYAWWTSSSNRTSAAQFKINHNGGLTTKYYTQKTDGNQWVCLGQYNFSAGTDGYVMVTDYASPDGLGYDTGIVMAGAIRFTSIDYGYASGDYNLHTFKYSIDGGAWTAPSGGDADSSLSSGWTNNGGSDYDAYSSFSGSTAYNFTWDTSGVLADSESSNVKVEFTVMDSVTQGTAYDIDSREETISESFSVDNVAPNQPTGASFTATGGTVVSDYINSTNTGFTVSFTSPASEYAGTAHLYLAGADFTTPITIPVSVDSTSYDLTGNSTSITELGADGAKTLTVVIIDSFGNVGTASSAVPITVDTTAPGVDSAHLDYDDGILVVTCDEAIDADPASKVDLSAIHINDTTTVDVVTLDSGLGASVDATQTTTVTITLTEAQRLAALAISDLTGGNGGAAVLDVDANAFRDMHGNYNAIDDNHTIDEDGTTTGTKLSFDTAPSTPVTAGDTWTTFTVDILDASDGRTIATDTVTIAPSSGSFSSGTTSKAAVGGVATFDDLIYSTANTITVTASADGLSSVVSGNIVVDTGDATQVVVLNPTDGDVDSDISVTIQIQDSEGNVVALVQDITVTVDGSAVISGVTTGTGDGSYNSQSEIITSSSGGEIVVTLHDETPETVNINVDHASLDDTSTQDVAFDNGAAYQVVITDPTDGDVDSDISVTIEVQDQYGNLMDTASESVTVTVDNNALISGVTTGTGDGSYNSQSEAITSDNGVIVVTLHDETPETVNINVDHATLTDTSTQDVVFDNGAADQVVITDPTDGTVDADISVTIEVQDQYGNLMDTASESVTVTVDNNALISGVTTGTGDGSYNSQSEAITSDNGVIVVTLHDETPETVNINVDHATLTDTSTQDVVFQHGAADHLKFSADISITPDAGVAFDLPSITAVDQYDNTAEDYSGSKTISYALSGVSNAPDGVGAGEDVYTANGISLPTSTTLSFSSGVSTTSPIKATLHYAQADVTITPSDAGLSGTNVASNAFTISPDTKIKLVFATPPSSSGIIYANLDTPPVVEIRDVYGNKTADTDTITLYDSNSDSEFDEADGSLTGYSLSATNGSATFTDLQYSVPGVIYLYASAAGLTPEFSSAITFSASATSTVDAADSPVSSFNLDPTDDADAAKFEVLKFKITDAGGDSVSTFIDRIQVAVSTTGTAVLSDIAWAGLYVGAVKVADAASIGSGYITFGSAPDAGNDADLSSGDLDIIAEGSSTEFIVYIYMKDTKLTATEDDTFTFDIDESLIGEDTGISSQMASDSEAVTPVTATVTVAVTYIEVVTSAGATSTTLTAGTPANIKLRAVDANRNVDEDYVSIHTFKFGRDSNGDIVLTDLSTINGHIPKTDTINFGTNKSLDFTAGESVVTALTAYAKEVDRTVSVADQVQTGLLCFPLNVTSVAAADGASIAVSSGNNQTAATSKDLSAPCIVLVSDTYGNPATGTTVNFAVSTSPANGASVSPSSADSGADGLASFTFTMGSVAQNYSATATNGSLAGSPVTFTATAISPSDLNIVSGDNQSIEVTQDAAALVVELLASTTPVPNEDISFAITSQPSGASASLSASSDSTDSNGQASITLTLGNKIGVYQVTASWGGFSQVFDVTGTPDSPDKVVLSGPSSVTAGSPSTVFTVEIQDQYDNASPVTAASTFTLTTTQSATGDFYSDSGCNTELDDDTLDMAFNESSAVFYYKDTLADDSPPELTVSLEGGQTGMTTTSDSQIVTVNPAALNYFTVTAAESTAMTAGGSRTITVKAYDEHTNLKTNYTGSQNIVFSGASTSPAPTSQAPTCSNNESTPVDIAFGSTTALTFSSGAADTTLKVYKAETAAVKATAGAVTTSAANDYDVVVMHDSADHLKLSANIPTPQTAGVQFSFGAYIDAVDAYSNLCDGTNGATAYSGTKEINWISTGTADGPEGTNDEYDESFIFTAGRTEEAPTATLYRATYPDSITLTPNDKASDLDGTNVASNAIIINPGDITGRKMKFYPPEPSTSCITSQALDDQPVVAITDAYGNPYTTASTNVTLRAYTTDGVNYFPVINGTLSATGGVTKGLTSGLATFAGVTYDYPEEIVIRAEESAYGLDEVYSSPITFSAAEEATLAASTALSEPATIASTVTTSAAKVDIFDFKISDGGADNIGTKIKQITINRSGEDTTGNWNNYINGVYITDGATQTIGVISIDGNSIDFGSGNDVKYTVADGGSKTFTMSLYLKASLPLGADNKVLGFSVDADSDISLDSVGSQFSATTALTSTTTITVTATNFKVTGTATMTAGTDNVITVKAIDVNGNIDADFDGDKDLIFSTTAGDGSVSPDGTKNPTCTNYGGAAVDFGSATSTVFTDGANTSTLTMVLYKAETAAVKATLGSIITATADALTVVVSGGAPGKLAWGTEPISPTVANAPWKGFTVTVTDTFGNDTTAATLITITPTGGTAVSGATATSDSGVATFNGFAVTCASYPGTVTVVASADGVIGTDSSDLITVDERYSVTIEVKDYSSSAHTNVETMVVTDSDGNSVDYLQTTTGIYTCNLLYGDYNLTLTKEAYLTTTAERTAGVSEDGADAGGYDNDITWEIIMTSLSEATADYSVKSGFVYNQNNDTLDVRVWLERRGILIVNDATNKLGDATVEIYGDTANPPIATFTIDGPDADDTTSGVYYRKITNVTDGTGIITLTSGQMYYTKCFIYYGGSTGISRTYQSGTTFEVGVASLVRIATDQIEGLSTEIKGEVTGVITSVEAQALITQASVAAQALKTQAAVSTQASTTQALVTSKVAGAVTSIGGTVSVSEAAIKALMSVESASRILNQDSTVKQSDTMKIRYKTTTGLSPTIDVYDADNTKRVDAATMTETVSGSGIYEYAVKFQWGVGEHTVICKESTKGTLDGINVMVITTDLEAISSAATTTMGQVANIDTGTLEAVPASIGSVVSTINSVSASLDELSSLSSKIKDSATSAVQNMYDELSLASEKMKEISKGQGLKIDAMYDISDEQATNVGYIKNKTQEIKAMVELQKEIIESESEAPVVTSWLESGETGLEAPVTMEGFEAELETEIGAEAEMEGFIPSPAEGAPEEEPRGQMKEEEPEARSEEAAEAEGEQKEEAEKKEEQKPAGSEFESMGEPQPEPVKEEPKEVE